MKNILLLNVGTRNSLVKNFKKSCGKKARIVATDSYFLAPALYDADSYYITRRWDEEGYWSQIEEICKAENIGLMLSLVDPELELLARNKRRFEQMGIAVCIGEYETVAKAFDKYETLEFVREHNYPWIQTYEKFQTIKEKLDEGAVRFPLVTKPRRGSGSNKVEIVNNIERLREIYEQEAEIVTQEYMGTEEIGVDVYVDMVSNEVISVFAKKKLKMRAGETDKSVSFKDEKLFDMIVRFAKEFGLYGVNDIDVFLKDDEYYISEVNPRFGGGYLHAYECGLDFPNMLMKNMDGRDNRANIGEYESDIYMMKFFSIKTMKGEETNE